MEFVGEIPYLFIVASYQNIATMCGGRKRYVCGSLLGGFVCYEICDVRSCTWVDTRRIVRFDFGKFQIGDRTVEVMSRGLQHVERRYITACLMEFED